MQCGERVSGCRSNVVMNLSTFTVILTLKRTKEKDCSISSSAEQQVSLKEEKVARKSSIV